MNKTPKSDSAASSASSIDDDQAGEDQFVTLGKVIGFFGVRGWVKVHSDTEPRENIVTYKQWWLGGEKDRRAVVVKNGKRSGKNVVAKLDGVETREQAEAYLGKDIAVPRSMLPAISDEEVYWTDLIGCQVESTDGTMIGPVKRLFETGANDVMVVEDARVQTGADTKAGATEILIPWIRPTVITKVDINNKRIVVDWDPDLL